MPDTQKTYLIPPEGHKDVGKTVFSVLGMVIEDKQAQGLHSKWRNFYKLRRSRHWSVQSSASLPLATANLIYTHIERTKNELTDNNPTFNVANIGVVDDTQKEVCSDLQRTAEHWWIDQEQQDVLDGSVLNGEVYGITIEKVLFNPDLEYGLGEVETEIVDPFYCGWYPTKLKDPKDINNPGKCEAFLHFYPKSIRSLRAKYPKIANKIKPDTELLGELNDDRREIYSTDTKGAGSNISLSGVIKTIYNFMAGSDNINEEDTVVCEMWLRDNTQALDGEPQEDEDGRVIQNYKGQYTGGIRYILACSGDVVLEDKDNPNINKNLPQDEAIKTYLYDKFPFVAVNSIKDTSNAWGISDIEQIEGLQRELNKSLSQSILEKDRMVRAKLLNPKNSGVQNEELTNYVGVVNPVSDMAAQGMRWLAPPPPTGDVQNSIETLKQLMLMIAGTFDLDMAQTGSQVIAYKAIAALLERAATMKRGKIRNYGRLIRERGRMFLSHVMNFYTEDRWITYNDENGQRAAKPINGSKMIIPAKLTVVTGSTLPISRVQQREEALSLFSSGAIDQQELLEKIDWSNRNEVIKRMQAGPLGQVFDKLSQVGVPPEVMEYLKTVAEADPKKLQQTIQKGEFPTFDQFSQQLLADMMQQGQVDPQTGQPIQPQEQPNPEAVKAQAEAKKIEAETALIAAKIQTEAVNQQVALNGVRFDEESLAIQRAKAVSEMESNIKSHAREDFKVGAEIVSNLNNRPGYNEKGMKSDNKEE
ncbi:MAG: phage portal protein [Syntrophotalea acetylenica]|nr:phage portal protein [Syntrophotalea acetylenica]